MQRRWRCGALLVFAVLASGLLAAVPAFASSPIDEKKAEAEQVYSRIQSLDEDLSAADEKVDLANLHLQQVAYNQRVNRRELGVSRLNLARSQRAVVERLRGLYTSPQSSSLDVILGATSLGNLIFRIDESDEVNAVDNKVIHEVYRFRSAVQRHKLELAHDQTEAQQLLAERQQAKDEINDEIADGNRLESQIQGEISTLEAQASERRIQMAREAQQEEQQQQAAEQQAAQETVVGASASTPEGATVVPSSSIGSRAVSIAMSYIGVPYVWGGASPSGFDCSGLVMYTYAQLGISLPHSSYAQWNYGESVPTDQLEPGDLVFFDSLGHVGIYIGGGEYVDAPYTGADVRVDSLDTSWAQANYSGARRIT